jgi:hypothetical protein
MDLFCSLHPHPKDIMEKRNHKSIMKTSKALLGLSSLVALSAFGVHTASAMDILYSEYFTNNTGSARAINGVNYNWDSFVGNTGTHTLGNTSISPNAGNPNSSTGYLVAQANPETPRILIHEFGTGIDFMPGGTNSEISFTMAPSLTYVQVRVMALVEGTWYASSSYFSSPSNDIDFAAASSEDVEKSLEFSLLAENWHELTFVENVTMVLAAGTLESDLTTSTIDGFGFYLENTHGSWGSYANLDTIEVSAVPETSNFALLLGIVALGFCGKRFKSRS